MCLEVRQVGLIAVNRYFLAIVPVQLGNIHPMQHVYVPLMTFPKVERDLLMAAPSFKRVPMAPVDSALSLHEGRQAGHLDTVLIRKFALSATNSFFSEQRSENKRHRIIFLQSFEFYG